MEHPIQVEFELNKELYQSVTRDLVHHTFIQKWRKWIGWALLGVVAFILLNSRGVFTWEVMLPQLMAALIFLGLWLSLLYFMPKMLIVKQIYPEPHPMRYTFTDADVKTSTATSESTIQWAAYIKAVETDQWLMLFQNKTMANPVLKSALSSGDLERLRELLRGKGLMKLEQPYSKMKRKA